MAQSALLILVVMIPVITIVTLLVGLLLHYLVAPRMGWSYPKATSILISFIIMAFLYAIALIIFVDSTSKTFNSRSYIILVTLFLSIIMMGAINYALMRSFEKEIDGKDDHSQ